MLLPYYYLDIKKFTCLFILFIYMGSYGQNGPDENACAIDKSVWSNTEVPSSDEDKIPLEEITYEMLTALGKEKNSTLENTWILKADEYFDTMRYAEAAELYETALTGNVDNYDIDILRKAGDAHYFNTNMERAYFWYQKLYDRKKKGMDADYLFKYAQALKGVGKYGRARRMMRIHDKKNGGLESMVKGSGIGKEMALGNTSTTRPNIVLKNVSINSKYSDFAPMFYKEDEIVYSSAKDFRPDTKRYKKNNPPFLDLYVAKV